MRKILLGLISMILLALSVYTVVYGINIGFIQISGIRVIKEENENLDKKIQETSNLRTKEYPQSVETLESAYKKLQTEKESYEQLLELGVDESGLPINKIQEYEIEKIWVTMGNYAKKQGVDVKMDIKSNNSVSKTYDLNFTVTGGYIQITDFLYDIERDTTLVFKIENFKLVPGGSTENLSATFVCKDIKLNIEENNNTSNTNNSETNTENEMNSTGETKSKETTDGTSNNKEKTNTTTNTKTNTTNTTTNANEQ